MQSEESNTTYRFMFNKPIRQNKFNPELTYDIVKIKQANKTYAESELTAPDIRHPTLDMS
jgi:hypothetical protein